LFAQLVVMALMRDHRILTQVGGHAVNIIKLLPPLIIGDEEVEVIVSALNDVLAEATHLTGRLWSLSARLAKKTIVA